jgi:Fe(3+) dicitrate transport protein
MRTPLFTALCLCIPLSSALQAAPLAAAQQLDRILVEAEALPDPRFPGVAKSIEDGKTKAGKKTTRVSLDQQPTVVENSLRRLLSRIPGVLVSEMRGPGHFNLNYRGLGDPHESEFITGLENGAPIGSDWFGYPTLYYLPPAGRVESVEFIRGGSALLFGPQPGPSLNFITRKPAFDQDARLRTDHVRGSDGLYQTFNEFGIGGERIALLADFDHRSADGERSNADFRANSGRVAVAIKAAEASLWDIELSTYDSSVGEPGRLSSSEFDGDPRLTKTPFNRLFIERTAASISNHTRINDDWSLHGLYQWSSQDRISRRSSAFVAPQTPPSSTNFDRQQFESQLLDLRASGDISADHSLSAGVTFYRNDSPRDRLRSEVLDGSYAGSTVFSQSRDSRYAAAFVEALLRFDRLSLVPALRQEQLRMGIDESVLQPGLPRPAINREFKRSESLLGFGALFELDLDQQLYANVSQGYRPMRYDDLGNPSSALGAGNDPDPARALNIEFGLRGRPIGAVYYDISAFRIDLEDKIEQRALSASDIVRINSGDSRHQGIEAGLEWQLFGAAADRSAPSLLLFANASLLDAEIVRSDSAALVGNTPAFAPEQILRVGALYRSAKGAQWGLTASHVSDHYWQDSNLASGSGSALIEAEVPAYSVVDLSLDLPISSQFTLLAGIGNVLDERYYSRVRSDGIEPAQDRSYYVGLSLKF